MTSVGVMASAVHIAGGACTDVLQEPFNDLYAWSFVAGNPAIVSAGRTGTAVQISSSSSNVADYTIPVANRSDIITVGFAWRYTDANAAGRDIFNLYSDLATTPVQHNQLTYTVSNSNLAFTRGITPLMNATVNLIQNVWYYIEVKCKLGDGDGFFIVRVNGTEVINVPAADTKNGGTSTVYEMLRLDVDASGCTGQWDDLYISTGSGCAFQGDHAIDPTTVLMEPFNDFSRWAVASSPVVVPARTGLGAEINSISDKLTYTIPLASQDTTIIVGCAVKLAPNAQTQTILRFYTGGLQTGALAVTTGDNVYATTAAGGQQAISTGALFTRDVWHYVEVRYTMHDTNGAVTVRLDGAELFTSTGFDSRAGSGTGYDQIGLETPNASSGGTVRYDDLYIARGAGTAFKGDQQIGPPSPTAPVMTGLIWWLDANDASTFTYSSGTVVSQWNDKSGNNRHVSQGTVANQPSRSGTQNGHPTVVFGTADQLKTAAPISTDVSNLTLIVACKRTGGNASQSVVVHNGDPDLNGYGMALRANSGNIGILRGMIGWNSTATADPAAASVLTLQRATGASGAWAMWLNGVATNLSTTATVNTPTTSTLIPDQVHAFEGEVYEILAYNTVLSAADRANTEMYLRAKWGTL